MLAELAPSFHEASIWGLESFKADEFLPAWAPRCSLAGEIRDSALHGPFLLETPQISQLWAGHNQSMAPPFSILSCC